MNSRIAFAALGAWLIACGGEAGVDATQAAASSAWASAVSDVRDSAVLFLEEERAMRTTECVLSDVECQEKRAQSRTADRLAALVVDEFADYRFASSQDADDAWQGLMDQLNASETGSERLALLTIALRVERLPRKTPPDEMVVLQPEESPAETMLWLELLARSGVGPSPSTAQRIQEVVCDSRVSTGFRGLALTALGHGHSANELEASVACVEAVEPIDRFWTNRFGNTLGRCGRACFSTIARLASSSFMWERQAGLQAAAMLPPAEQGVVAASIDRGNLEPWEQAFVERAVGGLE